MLLRREVRVPERLPLHHEPFRERYHLVVHHGVEPLSGAVVLGFDAGKVVRKDRVHVGQLTNNLGGLNFLLGKTDEAMSKSSVASTR